MKKSNKFVKNIHTVLFVVTVLISHFNAFCVHVKDKLHSRWTEKLEFKTILI